jgi:cytoskeletal protein CcmA (bactofilin family)
LSKIHNDLKQAEIDRLNQAAPSRIGPGIRINGEISGNGDLYVGGNVEGPLQLGDGKLMVEASGKLIGNVTSREAVIYGTLKGNLHIRESLEIRSRGSVVGDVVTERILIEDGAHFKGSIEIGAKESPKRLSANA